MTKKYYCNKCGRELDFWDIQEDFTLDKLQMGYGSKHDGSSLHLRLCARCMDEIIDSCMISPIEDYQNPCYVSPWEEEGYSGMLTNEDD